VGDLQDLNFPRLRSPIFTSQENDAHSHVEPPSLLSPTVRKQCLELSYIDGGHVNSIIPEENTVAASIEYPSSPSSNKETVSHPGNTDHSLLQNFPTAEDVDGLKNDSMDPALFTEQDMEEIFGTATLFDEGFELDDSFKLAAPSKWPANNQSLDTAPLLPKLASPFEPQSRSEHMQQHVELSSMARPETLTLFPEFNQPVTADNSQIMQHCMVANNGRRRSHSVPPGLGMGFPRPIVAPRKGNHHARLQEIPLPSYNCYNGPSYSRRMIEYGRSVQMTPQQVHLQRATSGMMFTPSSPMGSDIVRGQDMMGRRQPTARGRALSSEPDRRYPQKRQKQISEPTDPTIYHYQMMMGNVEFIMRQGFDGIRYRRNDDLERYVHLWHLSFLSMIPQNLDKQDRAKIDN